MTSVLIYQYTRYPFSNIMEYWINKDKIVEIFLQVPHYKHGIDHRKFKKDGYDGRHYELGIKHIEVPFDTLEQCWDLVDKLEKACIIPQIFDLEEEEKKVKNPPLVKPKPKVKKKKVIIGDGGDPI